MKKVLSFLAIVCITVFAKGQVSTYNFSSSSGSYLPLTTTTNVFNGAWDDNTAVSVPIGFSFNFNGTNYSTVNVHTNGYLTFGSTTTGYVPISGGSTVSGVISAFGRDLQSQNTAPLGSVDYNTSAGVFTVQWSNTRRYNGTTTNAERFEFQIKLEQTTNKISFIYGSWSDAVSATTTNVAEVGLRGTSGTDFKNLSIINTGNWAMPAAGAVNTATCFYNQSTVATKPALGQTYTFTPPPPCVAPAGQATGFTATAANSSTINGSYTATTADGYLVVRYSTGATPTLPVNGTTYTVLGSLGTGTIVASSASTSFSSGGLLPSTAYDYYVYSYNNSLCSGGPIYNVTSPAFASATTTPCSGPAAGTYSVGPTGTYTSLTSAFAALSSGSTGPIVLELQATYVSTVETFPITFTGSSCLTATNPITIRPAAGATNLSITSNNSTATIHFNGADYITIDGRPGGLGTTSQLTIENTAIGSAVAINFNNDATNNTIHYTTVKAGPSTSLGAIAFGGGLVTGNDNNTISNNTITSSGTNFPLNGIYSLGTSGTIDNSNNTVSNNNFADIFSATSSFAALNINTNNNDWTISNNKIYQSASRAVTTANTENGIFISGGKGYTITGNTIGFANANGTGTMQYTSTVALRYIGINASITTGSPATSIQGNTVANISFTTSSGAATGNGVLCGINVTGAGTINIGTVTGNTIGATTGTGSLAITPSTTQGAVVGINSSSTGTVAIQNNTIGALSSTNATTATVAGGIIGINVSGIATAMNISNNTIGNTTPNNMVGGVSGFTTGSSIVSGIGLASTTPAVINNNTVQNLTSIGAGTGGFVRGINTAAATGSASQLVITNNTLNNFTTNAANTSLANGVASVSGLMTGYGNNNIISQNTISNLSNTSAATTQINVNGIGHGNATNSTISRNRIYNLANAGTSTTATTPAVVAGIMVRSGTTGLDINNNMISLGAGQTTNTSFIGIQGNHGSTPDPISRIYFNSIIIEGVVAAGGQPSFAIARTDFSATARLAGFDVKNNILINTRTGGTGKHYAIANNFGATTSSATGWAAGASNFNVINNTVAANLTYWSGDKNFAAWQTASAGDANSMTAAALTFTNTATADLHITGVNPPIEGSGTPIAAITIDYDGDIRNNVSPTDIGADAGNFANYPVITYTPLANACATTARTLVATISDVDGVPTSGAGLPVLYWKINAGAYNAATATSLGGNQYQFTFGAGTAIGDVVSYYIAAQDNINNVGSNPIFGASGFTSSPPAVATAPTTPNSYTINTTLNGTYTVGVGGQYTTLTAAVNAYNTSCLTGPVVFKLIDATCPTEIYPITINANSDASVTNTLTIKATQANTVITGNSASAIIVLNGADYVTIDGSTSTVANTVCPVSQATRDLTIINTNTANTSAVVSLQTNSMNNGATNNRVMNCIVSGNTNTTTLATINISGPTIGNGIGSNFNNNNQIINNRLIKAQLGIFSAGASATLRNTGNIYSLNVMDGTVAATENIGRFGIMSLFEDGPQIMRNKIANIVSSASTDVGGIAVGTNGVTNTLALAGETINATVSYNTIDNILQTNTFSATGIVAGVANSGTTTIANNMVSNVYANGTAGDFASCIFVAGGTGSTNVWHNSVTLSTGAALTGASQPNVALAIGGTNPIVNVQNNIVVANGPGTGHTISNVAIGLAYAAPFTNLTSNNNNFFVSGTGSHIGISGGLASGTTATTLANWQTVTGKDGLTKNVLPTFISATDLHLSNMPNGTNWCLNNNGTPILTVSNDIDCDTRSTTLPDIGADEFTAMGFVVNNPAPVCQSTTVDLTLPAVTSGSMGGLTLTYWQDAAATLPLGGANAISNSGTYFIKAENAGCGFVLPVAVTVNPSPTLYTVTGGGAYCTGSTAPSVGLNNSQMGVNYQLFNGATPVGTAVAGTGAAIDFGVQATSGTYTVVATNTTTSCTSTMTGNATVTQNILPTQYNVTGGGSYCTGATAPSVGLSNSQSGVSYQLFNGVTPVGTALAGTGTAISFGAQNTAGTYTVVATNNTTTCTNTMTGSVSVTVNPLPTQYSVTGGGTYCSANTAPSVGLSNSQIGVNYQLYNGAAMVGTAIAGTGLAINFGAQSAAGTYTVVATNTTTTCTNTMTGNAIVTVNPSPVISEAKVEPTTCATTDGSITLTITGAAGPFTYAWTGTGVNATAQNQTGLQAGNYGVTVTDNITLCSTTKAITLIGPGGCNICPTIPTITLPTNAVCAGGTVNISTSTMTDMGVSYGVIFKYSTATLTDPYVGGTTIATVANGSLTSAGSAASTSIATLPAGTYNIYAIATPTPLDAMCRPFATGTVTVNPVPTVNTIANQNHCSGTSTTAINFSGSTAGTVYNWTSSNTTILPASGTGDIAAFVTSNTGAAPISTTVVVTPSYTNGGTTCTGTSTTFTITVNPIPNAIATPASQNICSGSSIVGIALTGAVTGTAYNWTRNNTATVTGIAASGLGSISGSLTNTTNAPVTVTFTITPSANGCTGTPVTATVVVNPIPNAIATSAIQTVCSGTPISNIVLTSAVAGTTFAWTRDNATVTGIAASGSGNISGTLTNSGITPVTVTFTITPSANGCTGTPITATVLVNPLPTATATPLTQTICSGATITPIALSSNITGTTYAWSRNNTTSVTGIAASGSGNITGSLVNNTSAPVTVTFTITPSLPTGCSGPAITASVIVNPIPVAIATPATQTVCSGSAITTVVLSSTVSGTTFTWTRDNAAITGIAASGTGNISGTLVNTGTTPGTVTFTITPSANGCTGTPITTTIQVNPVPTVTAVPTIQTICSGNAIATITATASITGTTINWTRNNTATVTGIAANGTGNPTGILVNTTTAPVTVTFTFTPTLNGCSGTPVTATVLVNPAPIVSLAPFASICKDGDAFLLTGGIPTGGVYRVDGVVQTVFTPANYTAGIHVISYTVTNATTGCFTIVTQNIEVFAQPNRPIAVPNLRNYLQSSVTANNYQWYLNNAPINNSNAITYTTPITGYYQVEVISGNACKNKSDSVYMVAAPTSAWWLDGQFAYVYPNPVASSNFILHFNLPTSKPIKFSFLTADGQLLQSGTIAAGSRTSRVNVSGYASGTYSLRLNDGTFDRVVRVIIAH